MQLVTGRVGKAHGIRGDVIVDPRTDDPELRFAPGSVLITDPAESGPLTVVSSRQHSGRWLVHFAGFDDRNAAESLSGTMLLVDSESLDPLADPDEFYDYQLVGLQVCLPTGEKVGEVIELMHGMGGETLLVRRVDDSELMVPFVRQIVPTVDIAAGTVVIDPPPGLLEL